MRRYVNIQIFGHPISGLAAWRVKDKIQDDILRDYGDRPEAVVPEWTPDRVLLRPGSDIPVAGERRAIRSAVARVQPNGAVWVAPQFDGVMVQRHMAGAVLPQPPEYSLDVGLVLAQVDLTHVGVTDIDPGQAGHAVALLILPEEQP